MLSKLAQMKKGYQFVSISPENLTGGKGEGGKTPLPEDPSFHPARDLGIGWKIQPCLGIGPGETLVLADVKDEGEICQIWLTPTGVWRGQIIRFYWDDEDVPAVECPLGDFFAQGLNEYAPVRSLPICVNPGSAFNCYWTMPFRKGFKITIENRNPDGVNLYYQINYIRKPVAKDALYFHAQFRRNNPQPYKVPFTMLDGIKGSGIYAGAYMTWGVHNNFWWGEGEVKIYVDGDDEWPSICYTGLEDYFCGSYDFENQKTHQYEEFTTAYAGLPQVIRPDTLYHPQMRFGMYRFHITDPVYFEKDVRVTTQALGWRGSVSNKPNRFLPLQDDISCVAYFYLDKPSCTLPPLGSPDDLELI